uniref:P-type domain-containing protein n=1 Tax=Mola mola TaxID=94237 RepID=A0A3Q4BHL6_MOLML
NILYIIDYSICTEAFVPQCPNLPMGERVDCFPDAGASKQGCEKRGCCWSPLDERKVPWCFFPTNRGYTAELEGTQNDYEIKAKLKRMAAPSLFGADIQELAFHAEMQTSNRLRFKIYDPQKQRFEVPHEHVSSLRSDRSSPISPTLEMTKQPFGLIVRRKDTTHNIISKLPCICSEVTLQPAPAVTYRTIGGVLDFYILLGKTPEEVVQQFLELVGRPVIPPYWSLGFQLSRWDYGSLTEVKETVERNRAVGLPYDIQYTDIDYMEDKKDFTYDKVNFTELPGFADYLHARGQKYILILDPAIGTSKRIGDASYESYDRGTAKNAWVTESDGKTLLLGEVWPGETVFPDYTSENCTEWWVDEYERFYKEVKHDALWIKKKKEKKTKKNPK